MCGRFLKDGVLFRFFWSKVKVCPPASLSAVRPIRQRRYLRRLFPAGRVCTSMDATPHHRWVEFFFALSCAARPTTRSPILHRTPPRAGRAGPFFLFFFFPFSFRQGVSLLQAGVPQRHAVEAGKSMTFGFLVDQVCVLWFGTRNRSQKPGRLPSWTWFEIRTKSPLRRSAKRRCLLVL